MSINQENMLLRHWIQLEHSDLWDLFEDLIKNKYFEGVDLE